MPKKQLFPKNWNLICIVSHLKLKSKNFFCKSKKRKVLLFQLFLMMELFFLKEKFGVPS